MRRISVRSLMAAVLVFTIGLAALRNAGNLWAGIILLLDLAALGGAVLGAAIMRGRKQAWWLGFTVFGAGYLMAASSSLGSDLPTTRMLPGAAILEAFLATGRRVFAFLAGLVGGTVATWFYNRRQGYEVQIG